MTIDRSRASYSGLIDRQTVTKADRPDVGGRSADLVAADLADAERANAESARELSRTFHGGIDDPYPLYRERRAHSPVREGDILAEFNVPSRALIAGWDGTIYTVYKYADITRVMREPKTFSSGFLKGRPGFLGEALTSLDGEEHRYQRNLFAKAFADRSALEAWQSNLIDQVVRQEIIAPLYAKKHADLLSDVGRRFPVRIMYEIIGYPNSKTDSDYFASQALWALSSVQTDEASSQMARIRAETAERQLYEYTMSAIKERRRAGLDGYCLINCLIDAQDENGNMLSDDQIARFTCSLLSAATESTTRSFANLMVLLFENPNQLEMIRRDRSLVQSAIIEGLRLEGAAAFLARFVEEDVILGEKKIKAGSVLSLALGSGNHDEDVFANGDSFDVLRPKKASIAFGYGPHACLGQQIAHMEIEAVLKNLLDFPGLRLSADQPPPQIKGLHFRSADSVPVCWN